MRCLRLLAALQEGLGSIPGTQTVCNTSPRESNTSSGLSGYRTQVVNRLLGRQPWELNLDPQYPHLQMSDVVDVILMLQRWRWGSLGLAD